MLVRAVLSLSSRCGPVAVSPEQVGPARRQSPIRHRPQLEACCIAILNVWHRLGNDKGPGSTNVLCDNPAPLARVLLSR